MLQAAPLACHNAKLDISRLIRASPSPSPATSPRAAAPPVDRHGVDGFDARAASVPPPSTLNFPPPSSQRTSTSSTRSTETSRVDVSTSASRLSISGPSYPSQPPSQHSDSLPPSGPQQVTRPQLPPITNAVSLPTSMISPQPSYAAPLPSASLNLPTKRPAPEMLHPAASPAKRQSKWTAEEDALIIDLRGSGMKWEDISKRLPGRSAISCRLHYQNYLERRSEWDEERKNRLARLYERLKPEMWAPLAAELGIPWRAAEAMHWQLGDLEMARRAGVVPFSLANPNASSTQTAPPGPSAGMGNLSNTNSAGTSSSMGGLSSPKPPAGMGSFSSPNPPAPLYSLAAGTRGMTAPAFDGAASRHLRSLHEMDGFMPRHVRPLNDLDESSNRHGRPPNDVLRRRGSSFGMTLPVPLHEFAGGGGGGGGGGSPVSSLPGLAEFERGVSVPDGDRYMDRR